MRKSNPYKTRVIKIYMNKAFKTEELVIEVIQFRSPILISNTVVHL